MTAPIGQTCPDINKLMRAISAMDLDKSDKQYILDALEDLRSGNEKLRKWGEMSESLLQKYQQEVIDMEDKLIEVRAELEQTSKTIGQLIGPAQQY